MISRCYRRRKEAAYDFQLHVFADSSMQAKCAVAYYRFCYENGEVGVSLVSSRVRVTPLKRITIPRLELDAVRMGINLAATIVEESSVKVQKIVLWTDSLICRHWLTQPSRRYKDYRGGSRVVQVISRNHSNVSKPAFVISKGLYCSSRDPLSSLFYCLL